MIFLWIKLLSIYVLTCAESFVRKKQKCAKSKERHTLMKVNYVQNQKRLFITK
jgi:hypothetical protein